MYQALYRKWRPRTFDDVVGQSHITDTLKQQVAAGRLSHAYLFTGTRGTGKTTCAKILARAVNCENPQDGDPCNACPSCLGIENGSILDVLELDAASNNGVDQVRALRDEAIYTPAAVRKRVYIVDEVHMLTIPAFNALLKILEEPPEHLMFILATTELHKVPATIKSRCQQFSFKRILPGQIAQRLEYVAQREQIQLTSQGAALLARLADGGLRDALSLLDQCSGASQKVDEQEILDTLGLAGNLETAALMGKIAARDTAVALETMGRLYSGGKDISSVLGELSALARDLLLRKTAPQAGTALLTGGYDETTMRALGEQFTAARLLQILSKIQETMALLPRSSSRRTDAELCLICLCDEGLDASLAGLSARIAQLEERLAKGIPAQAAPPQPQRSVPSKPAPVDDLPPWEEELPPLPEEPPGLPDFEAPEEPTRRAPVQTAPPEATQPRQTPAASTGTGDGSFWPSFIAGTQVPPSVRPYFSNPNKVTGTWRPGVLTLWVDSEFTRGMLNKPNVTDALIRAATLRFNQDARVEFRLGKPPADALVTPTPKPPKAEEDPLDALLAFGAQFDNIEIK